MQYLGGEKLAGKKAVATAVSFSGGGAAHLSGLPDGTTCSLAKRSASDETAEQVAESATVVGEGLLGAKAPRPSGRCLRQRSLAGARVEP